MADDEDFPWAEWKRSEARAEAAEKALADEKARIVALGSIHEQMMLAEKSLAERDATIEVLVEVCRNVRDRIENGEPCYEDVETRDGFLGNAVNESSAEVEALDAALANLPAATQRSLALNEAARKVNAFHRNCGHADSCPATCDAWDGHVCYQPESVQPKCTCGLGAALAALDALLKEEP